MILAVKKILLQKIDATKVTLSNSVSTLLLRPLAINRRELLFVGDFVPKIEFRCLLTVKSDDDTGSIKRFHCKKEKDAELPFSKLVWINSYVDFRSNGVSFSTALLATLPSGMSLTYYLHIRLTLKEDQSQF